MRALKEAGAEAFVELAPDAEGVKVDVVEGDVGYGDGAKAGLSV
jgi:hypothetical protein